MENGGAAALEDEAPIDREGLVDFISSVSGPSLGVDPDTVQGFVKKALVTLTRFATDQTEGVLLVSAEFQVFADGFGVSSEGHFQSDFEATVGCLGMCVFVCVCVCVCTCVCLCVCGCVQEKGAVVSVALNPTSAVAKTATVVFAKAAPTLTRDQPLATQIRF